MTRPACPRPLFLLLLLLGLSLLLAGPPLAPQARAEKLAGSDAPAFRAALTLWLNDDERTALPALADLARGGNQAARLLLALIDKDPSLQGPWLALQDKGLRIALLRSEGGLSGQSWLRRLDSHPYARALLSVLDSRAGIETALSFADMGEDRATRLGLIALEARQITGFAAYADDPRFPSELRYLIWRDWLREGENLDRLAAELNALHPGDPQRGIVGPAPGAAALEAWFGQTELAPGLRALCSAACPQGARACMRAGLASLGGYRRLAMRGTPMAALIPEARFAASARGQRTVLRRAMSFAFLTENRLKPIRQIDACFADLLEAEGQKF